MIEVKGCIGPGSHEYCDKIQIAKIPKRSNAYSLIKIEFDPLEDSDMLNAANVATYVGVEFQSKNS